MKTAMQELIDSIRFTDKECYATMFNEGIFNKALEKEKEQIKNAWYNGGLNGMGLFEINTGEEYYNQTYNNGI